MLVPNNFIDLMRRVDLPLNTGEFLELINSSYQCVFVKNENSNYQYANRNYLQLMGLQSLSQLMSLNDADLSKSKSDAKKYREHDEYVIEEAKILSVSEEISPYHNQPISKTMTGKLYPLFAESNRYVLGVITPQYNLLRLDFDTIFKLTPNELDQLLIKRRYKVQFELSVIYLSKKEICVLIQLLKGAHAGEIAEKLYVKQTTIESYLVNIKNKLGVNNKSELIQRIINEKLLEQIIL